MDSIIFLVVLKWSSLFVDVCHVRKHRMGKNQTNKYIHIINHIIMGTRHQICGKMQRLFILEFRVYRTRLQSVQRFFYFSFF